MNLEPFVAVSGESGLFKLVTSRNNGLVLESLDTGKSRFYSVRKHQFTPLGTVAIYTLQDATPLNEIFETMKSRLNTTPPVSVKAPKHEIEEYFESILPDYDEDRVFVNDMKKVIRWFGFLENRGLLDTSDQEE